MRRPGTAMWLAVAAFAGAFLSRAAWFYRAPFTPDASTVLWMALDAVRHPALPDHGLVSSYNVFQPPGLVWLTMPAVAVGHGRPEVVMVAFALVNAAAIALLVATVARYHGLVYGAALGAFLVVGPDAFFSPWIWHPSLYTAATALLLAAALRLRHGETIWWSLPVLIVPGLYALIHYSGFVLFAPALVLLLLAGRQVRHLLVPVACAATALAIAWTPFLHFELFRRWVDLTTIFDASHSSTGFWGNVEDRARGARFALSHLGETFDGEVQLTHLIWALVLAAIAIALLRRRSTDPGFALPAAMLAAGLAGQVALDQGSRLDVLMLWHVPLYALSAWAIAQLVDLTREAFDRRAAVVVTTGLVTLVLVVGSSDLANSIRAQPYSHRLNEEWKVARINPSNERYLASAYPDRSANRFYLRCDPPYDWGSEIWYLEEVLDPGSGWEDAAQNHAFRQRPSCEPG